LIKIGTVLISPVTLILRILSEMNIKSFGKAQIIEFVALFIFSTALLAIQVSFTKFFSIVMWYHFGFMIISVAMLGFSVSGVFLSMAVNYSKKFTFPVLVSVSSAMTFLSYIVLTRMTFTPINLVFKGTGLFTLVLMLFSLFVPFFLFGLTTGWILRERKKEIGIYYSVNMTGSAFGAILFILLFNSFNGQVVIPLITFLMSISALVCAVELKEKIISAIVPVIIFPTLFFPALFPMDPPGDKILGLVKDRANDVIYTGWSALSKVDVIKDPDRSAYPSIGLWGISPVFKEDGRIFPERMGVVIDSWAYTSIFKYPQDFDFFDYFPTTLVYHLGGNNVSSLHIGAGGGMDLLAARHYGVKNVTGIEINPVIVKAVQNEFKEYSGGIYSGNIEGIEIVVDEGRNFIESSNISYDIIQLSGVDTFSSTHAGAFALSENNLYSVEAFRSYYEKLNEDGYFTMTSWFAPDETGTPRFSIRLLNIVRDSLTGMGIDPKNRVMFIVSDVYTLLVLKKGVFSYAEMLKGSEYIEKNKFVPLVMPYKETVESNVFQKFLYADDAASEKLIDEYPYIVSPPTDDRPFFFELRKLNTLFAGINSGVLPLNIFSGQTILFAILLILLFLGAMLILQPLYFFRLKNKTDLALYKLGYFSLIGLGFMFVEIVLTQKLVLYLGHPSYSLSIALFSILLFSGLGSFFSNSRILRKRTTLFMLCAILLAVIFLLSPTLHATLGLPFGIRVLITLFIIAPVSFLMGTAFPAGAGMVRESELPFLWGINGFFSVIGSVVATIVSINFGFTAVFYLAFICYTGVALIMFFQFKEGVENE